MDGCAESTRTHRPRGTMTTKTVLTEEQLICQAGSCGGHRFLSLKPQGRLESVERHRLWQSGLEQEEFFDEVFGQERQ